jgi:HNH endonuclease
MKSNHRDRTLEQQLASRIEIDPLSGCHLWQGTRNSGGYPTIRLHGRNQLVHRLLWTVKFGAIPDGFELCHRCDEPRCVNPDHHFVGTHQANMADRRQKRRARIERAMADFESGPTGAKAELTRMRMYVRGVEITGKVRIRPFIPGALPARRKAAR